MYQLDIGAYKYCQNYCPHGFTDGGTPTCTPPTSDFLIFEGVFNTFVGPWTYGSITATEQNGVMPAKERGSYFKSVNQYMSFSDHKLHFDFTITGWIRLDDLTADYTIYSKDRGVFPNSTVFRGYVTATDGFLKVDLADFDDFSTVESLVSTGSNKVPEKDWTLVGYSVTMKTTTTNADVRLWIDNTSGETFSTTNVIYLDDSTAHSAYLGAYRQTDVSTFSGHLKGFIYNFYIYNQATPSSSPQYPTSACSGCGALKCTAVITQCLGNWEFSEYAPGSPCTSPSCDATGCVRAETCG